MGSWIRPGRGQEVMDQPRVGSRWSWISPGRGQWVLDQPRPGGVSGGFGSAPGGIRGVPDQPREGSGYPGSATVRVGGIGSFGVILTLSPYVI